MLRPETSPSCSRATQLCTSSYMLCRVRKLSLEGSIGTVARSHHHAKLWRQMRPNWSCFTFLPQDPHLFHVTGSFDCTRHFWSISRRQAPSSPHHCQLKKCPRRSPSPKLR